MSEVPDDFLRRVIAQREREQATADDPWGDEARSRWLDGQTKRATCGVCGDRLAYTKERRGRRTRVCQKRECWREGMRRDRIARAASSRSDF